MDKKYLYIIIGVLVAGIIALGIYHNHYVNSQKLTLDDLKKTHKREYEALKATADDLADRLEHAKGESIIVPVYKDRYIVTDNPQARPVRPLPQSCVNCFNQIEGLDYNYSNEYFSLNDHIFYDNEQNALRAVGANVNINREAFENAVVDDGLHNVIAEEEKPWRLRYIAQVDMGVQNNSDKYVSDVGVGIGVEFLNLEKYLRAEVGVNAAATIVPTEVEESHLSLGVDWRFLDNASVGLSYGRSVGSDMMLLNVNFFPVD